jgi:hypothetical protein
VSDIQSYRERDEAFASYYNNPPCGPAIDKVAFLMEALRQALDISGNGEPARRLAHRVMAAIAAVDTEAVEAALADKVTPGAELSAN